MSSNHKPLTSTFLLQCNGVPGPSGKTTGRSRTVEVKPLTTYGAASNVVLKVADISDRMTQRVPAVVVDLLEIAALVYAADQCCLRTPGRRFDYGRRWHRLMRFEVAVRRPGFWNSPAVREALGKTLTFLSEDDYEFNFYQAINPPMPQEYFDYGSANLTQAGIQEVMLMSGGLDSLAGAVQQVLQRKRHVAMVSHRPVGHMGKRQEELVKAIADRTSLRKLNPFHVPVTAHKCGMDGEDFTQRSRSFLYASIGAAVADMFSLSEVWFYENGVTSINLPLCGQEIGGRATRTTHPQAMHGFGKILSLVFERPFEVKNGFFWQTKQDVLEVLHRVSQSELAQDSVSCSHTHQTTNNAPHCGLCSQCLARRVAAIGAHYGEDDPSAGYRQNPLTCPRRHDEERILAERFVGQSRDVARMTNLDEFTRRYAGELSRVYPYLNMPPSIAAERLFELHRRHAQQAGAAMVSQMSTFAGAHWQGLLSDDSALAYAFATGKNAPGGRRRAARDTTSTTAPGPETSAFSIDEETFTVTGTSGRSHVFRSRSKHLFALLARTARRQGTRVGFDQLRALGDVWNGAQVEDVTIRGAISRLRQELRKARLDEVADALVTSAINGRAFVIFDPVFECANHFS
jgi:7-cyano-7-deazaguanine synthase in queuosine biosynthesis